MWGISTSINFRHLAHTICTAYGTLPALPLTSCNPDQHSYKFNAGSNSYLVLISTVVPMDFVDFLYGFLHCVYLLLSSYYVVRLLVMLLRVVSNLSYISCIIENYNSFDQIFTQYIYIVELGHNKFWFDMSFLSGKYLNTDFMYAKNLQNNIQWKVVELFWRYTKNVSSQKIKFVILYDSLANVKSTFHPFISWSQGGLCLAKLWTKVAWKTTSQIAKFMGPTWVLSAPDGPHDGPWSLLLGIVFHPFHSFSAMFLQLFPLMTCWLH